MNTAVEDGPTPAQIQDAHRSATALVRSLVNGQDNVALALVGTLDDYETGLLVGVLAAQTAALLVEVAHLTRARPTGVIDTRPHVFEEPTGDPDAG